MNIASFEYLKVWYNKLFITKSQSNEFFSVRNFLENNDINSYLNCSSFTFGLKKNGFKETADVCIINTILYYKCHWWKSHRGQFCVTMVTGEGAQNKAHSCTFLLHLLICWTQIRNLKCMTSHIQQLLTQPCHLV